MAKEFQINMFPNKSLLKNNGDEIWAPKGFKQEFYSHKGSMITNKILFYSTVTDDSVKIDDNGTITVFRS